MTTPRSNLQLVTVLVALLSLSPIASATEKGWYLGFMIGESKLVSPEEFDDFCNTLFVVCGGDEGDTAFQFLGGYQANNYFAVELAYFDLGSPSVSVTAPLPASAQATMKGGVLSVLPQIPIGSVGAIFGRLGLAGGDAEVSAELPALGRVESESSVAGTVVYGAGGALNLGRRASLRLEWTRYAFDETLQLAGQDLVVPDVDVFGASVVFRFPRN